MEMMEKKLRQLAALQELPDAVMLFLRALPPAVRIYEQVPQSERSPSTLIDSLEGLLSPTGEYEEAAKRTLREHEPYLQAMLLLLREYEKEPHLLLLEPSEGPLQ